MSVSDRPKVSDCTISAGCIGRVSAWRSIWSAKFSVAPGNQTAPGILVSARTTLGGAGSCRVEEIPDRRPEPVKIGDAPFPERIVIGESAARGSPPASG